MKSVACAALAALFSCGGGSSTNAAAPAPPQQAPAHSTPAHSTQSCGASVSGARPVDGFTPSAPAGLHVAGGLRLQRIAAVPSARELAFAPDGDLFVGTGGSEIYIVPNADGRANAGAARVYATLPEAPAAGVAFHASSCTLYAASESGIYRMPFHNGDVHAPSAVSIARVRTGGTGGHPTTSLALTATALYASVGSSCNACAESDPTRATIQQLHLDGTAMKSRAVRIRNAIALTVNPNTGSLWAGDAGQDALPQGHPYEFFDDVSAHAPVANYGWPDCEENHRAYGGGADCSNTVAPLVEFPAYSTLTGAAFLPSTPHGAFALPPRFAGGAVVAAHGSWHALYGVPVAPPRLAFVAMRGDTPARTVNWSDASTQWVDFVTGFQTADGSRVARPSGVAIGPQGDVFFSDDQTGSVYRIRP